MYFEDNCLWFRACGILNYYALGTHSDVRARASAVAPFLVERLWVEFRRQRREGVETHRDGEFARERGGVRKLP